MVFFLDAGSAIYVHSTGECIGLGKDNERRKLFGGGPPRRPRRDVIPVGTRVTVHYEPTHPTTSGLNVTTFTPTSRARGVLFS